MRNARIIVTGLNGNLFRETFDSSRIDNTKNDLHASGESDFPVKHGLGGIPKVVDWLCANIASGNNNHVIVAVTFLP